MNCFSFTLVVILLQCACPGTDSHFIIDVIPELLRKPKEWIQHIAEDGSKVVGYSVDSSKNVLNNTSSAVFQYPSYKYIRTVENVAEIPKSVISGSTKIWKTLVKKFAFDLPLAGLGKTWAYDASEDGVMRLITMTLDGVDDYMSDLSSDKYVEELAQKPVRFWLYTRKNKKKYEALNVTKLKSKYYRKRKPLMVITHGWISNGETNATQLIKKALLKKLDLNAIIVDWREIANKDYFVAASTVPFVGEKICELIKGMSSSKQFKVKARDVRLVGHSLGAHVMGVAGDCLRNANFHVSRLTGLDPARPFFEFPSLLRGLKKQDARFVDVIHTNAGILGVYFATGHADFYPNGGIGQPGCYESTSMTPIVCDHSSAYHFFAESILKDVYEGARCVSYLFYRLGACPSTGRSPMGYHCEDTAAGNYYLQTPPVYNVF